MSSNLRSKMNLGKDTTLAVELDQLIELNSIRNDLVQTQSKLQKVLEKIVQIQRWFKRKKFYKSIEARIEERKVKAALFIQRKFRNKNQNKKKNLLYQGDFTISDNKSQVQIEVYMNQEKKNPWKINTQSLDVIKLQASLKDKPHSKIDYQLNKKEEKDQFLNDKESFLLNFAKQRIIINEQGNLEVLDAIVAKEVTELVSQVLKIQSVFRAQKVRKELKNIRKEPVADTDKTVIVEDNAITLDQFNLKEQSNLPKDDDKELIYIYQCQPSLQNQEDQKNSKTLVHLYVNHEKMLIILKSDGCDPLSMYINDFLSRFQLSPSLIGSKEEIFKQMKFILPQVTLVRDQTIVLDKAKIQTLNSQIKQDQEKVYSQNIRGGSSDQVFQSFGTQEALRSSLNDEDKQAIFSGNLNQINPKNLVFEMIMNDLKLDSYLQSLTFTLFKDMIDNLFLKVSKTNEEGYLIVERINPLRVFQVNLEVKQEEYKLNSIEQVGEALKQEINIRIGLMNGGLEDQEYLKWEQIEKFVKAYGFNPDEEYFNQIQNMGQIVAKTKLIQKAFRKKKLKTVTLKKENYQEPKPTAKVESIQNEQNYQQKQNSSINNSIVPEQESKNHPIQSNKLLLADLSHKKPLTIFKQQNFNISGLLCNLEVKVLYSTDSLLFKAQPLNGSQTSLEIEIEQAGLQGKSLKDLTQECVDIAQRLELSEDKKKLQIRDTIADSSILSQDLLFKRGVEISGRFFIVGVAMQDNHLVIDAYEDKTNKRLEIKIKRQSKKQISGDYQMPTEKEIMKLVSRLQVTQIKMGKQQVEEVLTLKN